jgi:hypothetical protein
MSQTPHPTDVEVSRALNALVVTLNDRRAGADVEREQLQRIVTAPSGEARILLRPGGDASALIS